MRQAEHGYEIIRPDSSFQDNDQAIDISDFLGTVANSRW